jgi:hypothetical protein
MASNAMRVLSTDGLVVIEVDRPADQRLIGEHHNAIRRTMEGELAAITRFRGRSVEGYSASTRKRTRVELESDLTRLKRWYAQGDLDYEDIYESA